MSDPTERQCNLIESLLAETNTDFPLPDNMTFDQASGIISTLLQHKHAAPKEFGSVIFHAVQSSNIARIGYAFNTIYVHFLNGAVYKFAPATPELYTRFRHAESKGKFFIEYIKPLPEWSKVRGRNEAQTQEQAPIVEEGRYAVDDPKLNKLRFFRYAKRRTPYLGQTMKLIELFGAPGNFREQFISPSATNAILNLIVAAGAQEARARFGQEVGSCGCCGSPLTDERSRQLGIGPICEKKYGYVL